MSIQKVNELLQEAKQIAMKSGGDSGELNKSIQKNRNALLLAKKLTENDPNVILHWQLFFGCMGQSGVWEASDGDFHEKQLEVVENLIRLNPEDNDDYYKGSFFEPDYADEGGLYYFKFQALCDLYYFGVEEEGWPDSIHGRIAKEAIEKAAELHPDTIDFLIEEAEAVDIDLSYLEN